VPARTCASRSPLLAVAGAEKLIRREIDANATSALLDELAAQL
jgi:F-type H+-transporting ATPase subunit b